MEGWIPWAGSGWRPASEDCPSRGGGLPHEINSSQKCHHCGALIVLDLGSTPPIPVVFEVKPMPETPPPDPWKGNPSGLIDGLLDRRSMPDPRHLEAFLVDHSFKQGFQAGIDAALDQLVPALKAVMLLPPHNNATGSLPRAGVEKIIGRVPLKRTATGWE